MKIRSITLENVRRFAGRVTVGPLAEGITLLCEPNEAGKSTLFDALHALFFVKHGSRSKDVVALQPHSGGGVAVEAEIETDGTTWRIAKRWLQGAEARVWKDGTLHRQGGEAEDWIARLVGGGGVGPTGLLWVRQGLTRLGDGTSRERDDAQAARRDLMSSVAGAVDDMTGGRRMDRTRRTVADELEELQTGSGKSKKGGRWHATGEEVADLEREEARLAGSVEELAGALEERRRARHALADLGDEEHRAATRRQLAEARQALAGAQRHAERIDSAEARLRLAGAERQQAEARRRGLEAATRTAEEATTALATARARAEETDTAFRAKNGRFLAAAEDLKEGKAEPETAERIARRVRARALARDCAERRAALTAEIERAERARNDAEDAAAEVRNGPKDVVIDDFERLAGEIRAARQTDEQNAPRIALDYAEDAAPVELDGRPLPAGEERPVPGGATLVLPGLGRLRIVVPGAEAADARRDVLERRLADALAAHGWEAVADAHAGVAARRRAEEARAVAEATLSALAPAGIDALREALARIAAPAEDDAAELPDPEEAERRLEAARQALAGAEDRAERARAARDEARDEATRAAAAREAAESNLSRAAAALEEFAGETEAALEASARETAAACEEAERTLARLRQDAPDLAAAEAEVKRLEGVESETESELRRLEGRAAELDTLIRERAGAGVEEELAATREALADARERLQRIAFEVDVLRRLAAALEAARAEAREHYFAPVARELRPLLGLLWPDATLKWADDTLLPTALIRDGREEPVEILSGGTQEQVAFLVRLAFARLLAGSGRHAPIVLDDALVYSDDDRIERMFAALHRIGGDIQIVVLSCRQRAFRELGAPRVRFETVPSWTEETV